MPHQIDFPVKSFRINMFTDKLKKKLKIHLSDLQGIQSFLGSMVFSIHF